MKMYDRFGKEWTLYDERSATEGLGEYTGIGAKKPFTGGMEQFQVVLSLCNSVDYWANRYKDLEAELNRSRDFLAPRY